MGKNQAYKAMQRAKMSSAGGPDEIEDGMMDGSFHSPEWHAARLASLQTSHTVTWDEFNKRQKEAEKKRNELEADEVRLMKEYRAQLDAERAMKLARGRNHTDKKAEKGKKDRNKERKSTKKKKHSGKRHRDTSSSGSYSDSSSSDDERHSHKKERSGSKRSRKDKKQKSRKKRARQSDDSSSSESKEQGPVALSSFFGKKND